eukprot:TRINITY_DN5658_c0_g1_i1.p1 TRINITY_DN5658_c0_g1~~TRINITY_DN5658_c0_g1_i1.p1  ORF type:complete len:720 (-),score=191.89 TRINITY_DN5658_c0_g1_i1:67-2226(-)
MKHNSTVTIVALLVVLAGLATATKMGVWMMSREAVSEHETMRVTIHLKQRNLDQLDRVFNAVTDPDSPEYGKYLTMDQVTSIVAPLTEALNTVTAWLKANGAERIDVVNNKDVIKAYLPKKHVERAFNVQIKRFDAHGKTIFRSLEKHVTPAEISHHVDLIQGISDYPLFPRTRANIKPTTTIASNVQAKKPLPMSTPILSAKSRGGAPQVSVTYYVVCANGIYSNTTEPCANTSPSVTSIFIQAVSNSDVWPKRYLATANTTADCTIEQDSGRTICTSSVPVDYYVPVILQVQAEFMEDQLGPMTTNDHPAVATPAVVPQTINSIYNIPQNWQPMQPSKLSQAVVEFEQQYYSPDDLQLFFDAMGIVNTAEVTVVGPNDITNPGVEANLDIQYMMGIAPSVPTTYWSIAANSTLEIDDILQWAVAMSNTANPPVVNSLSYGMSERNVDTYLGKGYVLRSDTEFKKLATRGITIIIADGDVGAGDLGDPPMSVPSCMKTLNPDWPSQSPYVTAVGSTYFSPLAQPICYMPKSKGGVPCYNNPMGEVGVSLDDGINWTTGGGFSNVQPRPGYQKQFVEGYLTNHADLLPPDSAFNRTGRAYPDVATVGHNLMVAYQGQFIGVDGTSASAPIFGGIVSLLNDVRVRNGKPMLGFLNPLLYKIAEKNAAAFRDIVVGQNRCGAYGITPDCCAFGYFAVPGWDPMTGLGTPNFAMLAQELLNY